MRFLFGLFPSVIVALSLVALLSLSTTFAGETEAMNFKFIGAKGCNHCHAKAKNGRIYEQWQETPHAKAFDSLGEADRENEACLGCHTTGYGRPIAAGTTADQLHGVQCEACHGPGSKYKAMKLMKNREMAIAEGMVIPSVETCLVCHTTRLPQSCWAGKTSAPHFDFDSAYQKIEHHLPPKK